MPRAFLASGGADFSQASLMSLRRPCLRPSQWRRKASTSERTVSLRTSSARVAKAASREDSSKSGELGDGFVHGAVFRINDCEELWLCDGFDWRP